MRRLKKQLHLHAKKLKHTFKRRHYPEKYIHSNIPCYCQWESRELVEPIISKQIDAKSDPNWRGSGANDVEEYAEWSWNGCGMACLKMIVAATQDRVIPLVELGKKCTTYGGYEMPLHSSPGLFYKPFLKFISHEFGLRGTSVSALTLSEVKTTLSKGGYVIASVTPEIRFATSTPTKRGGHLVLVLGYDDAQGTIFMHNPSGFEGSQEYVELSQKQFMRFFDNKGLLIFAD